MPSIKSLRPGRQWHHHVIHLFHSLYLPCLPDSTPPFNHFFLPHGFPPFYPSSLCPSIILSRHPLIPFPLHPLLPPAFLPVSVRNSLFIDAIKKMNPQEKKKKNYSNVLNAKYIDCFCACPLVDQQEGVSVSLWVTIQGSGFRSV